MFQFLCTKQNKYELKRYWNLIREDHNVAEAYDESIINYEINKKPNPSQVSSKWEIINIKFKIIK